jgi:predicted metalloprotease
MNRDETPRTGPTAPGQRRKRLARGAAVLVSAAALVGAAGCGLTGPHTSDSSGRVSLQQQLAGYAAASAAPAGTNGLANAPVDPSSSDAAEAEFVRYVFHEVADFWQNTEGTKLDPGVTLQPVDATNNPVPCVDPASGQVENEDVSQVGPFYCDDDGQGNRVIYWPLQSVFTLPDGSSIPSFGAFAEADAVAHEFGHYIQDLNGILGPVHDKEIAAIEQGDDRTAAEWSQGTELQADCLAGDWVRSQWDQGTLTQDDLTAAANLTNAVGDDALDPTSQYSPPANAHGTSALRLKWLNVGITDGVPADCNTWSEPLEGGADG